MKIIFYLTLFLCFLTHKEASSQTRADTLKVLAIGNSFSDDGVEYLDELAQAAGVHIVVGNISLGGCSLERHTYNITADKPLYHYYKNIGNVATTRKNIALQAAMADEDWDVVTVQQASRFSGMIETYVPHLHDLLTLIKPLALNPRARFAFHQTWAYQQTSNHDDFANYNNSQQQMYQAIMKTVREMTRREQIKTVIPSGTTIQNLRAELADTLCRDGYHLTLTLGRYAAACAWFETLCKRSAVQNSYAPPGLSAHEARMAREAAHRAVRSPYAVTVSRKPAHRERSTK